MQRLKGLVLSLLVCASPCAYAEDPKAVKPGAQVTAKPTPRVFVAASDGSMFRRTDATTVQFVKGNLLVSVKPPLQSATVRTPFGTVTVPADSVVYVSLANGELQVQHLHGVQGSNLSASLRTGLFKDAGDRPLTIAVGQHMKGSMPVRTAPAAKEAVPPLPTPVPTVVPIPEAGLQVTGRTINSMANNLPNLASRKRFATMTKTPLIDDWVDDLNLGDMKMDSDSVDNATGGDTTTSITSPDDVPSTDIDPADSFQTARENVRQGEFQPEAATQDDSGMADMWGRALEGPDLDATGGMLEPGDSLQ
jgi:hypothetical protein